MAAMRTDARWPFSKFVISFLFVVFVKKSLFTNNKVSLGLNKFDAAIIYDCMWQYYKRTNMVYLRRNIFLQILLLVLTKGKSSMYQGMRFYTVAECKQCL